MPPLPFESTALRVWKKRLVVGAVVFVFMCVTVGGVGAYGLYAVGKTLKSKVGASHVSLSVSEINEAQFHGIVGFVFDAASQWALIAVDSKELQSVKHGAICLQVLGGPDASQFLNAIAQSTANREASKAMQRLSAEIGQVAKHGPGSCVSFLAG